jgi:SAM-dependent methyltransferase
MLKEQMNDTVSPWVQRFAPLIPGGEVLDLACGNGRHSRHLVTLGHAVIAVDRRPDALAASAGPGIVTSDIDLEAPGAAWPFGPNRFAGIVVTNYLYRPLLADMVGSLAPNGVLVYETFADGNAAFGKPSNPDFLLKAGELLELARQQGLRVIAYEDGIVNGSESGSGAQDGQPGGKTENRAMVQRLCAVKAEFPREAALLGCIES